MTAVASPDFTAASRLRAQRIVRLTLGYLPILKSRPGDLEVRDLVSVLLALESAFTILLDADEAMDCPDWPALLDLVERRIVAPDTCPPCALYDFAAYRDALGGPDFGREPDFQIDPAFFAAAFPSGEPAPPRRRAGLRDLGVGLLIGVAVLLVAGGWANRTLPLPLASPAALAVLDALR